MSSASASNYAPTIILCHGRKHSKIKDIDYSQTSFFDIEPKTKPDFTVDITSVELPETKQTERIIMYNCPNHIILTNIKKDEWGMPVSGNARTIFIKNLKALLKNGGELYITPPFFKSLGDGEYKHDIDQLAALLAPEKFILDRREVIGKNDFYVFKFSN